MIKYLIILFTGLLFTTIWYGNEIVIHFYSPDKLQCITVISRNSTRYIIDGKYSELPDTNYVKLQIEHMNSMFDNLYICWRNKKYEWDVVAEYSIVLESKLDTTRYVFNTELPNDERGIPTDKKYSAAYAFELDELIPNKGAIVEYEMTKLGKIFYLLIVLLFISIINNYANKYLEENSQEKFSKGKVFIQKKYFTKKGWFLKIFTYSLIGFFFILLII